MESLIIFRYMIHMMRKYWMQILFWQFFICNDIYAFNEVPLHINAFTRICASKSAMRTYGKYGASHHHHVVDWLECRPGLGVHANVDFPHDHLPLTPCTPPTTFVARCEKTARWKMLIRLAFGRIWDWSQVCSMPNRSLIVCSYLHHQSREREWERVELCVCIV